MTLPNLLMIIVKIKNTLNCNITIKKNTPIKMKISTNKNTCYNELYSNICVEDVSNMIPIDALKTPISVERVVKQISKQVIHLFTLKI